MPAPEVTVIIPTHNRPEAVRRAVASVIAQTCTAWQAIVVDDGSRAPVTSRTLRTDDPRISIVRHDLARGVAHARNAGLDRAATDWVAFLDDDDLWAPWKLAAQLGLARRTGAEFVYTSSVHVTPGGTSLFEARVAPTANLTRDLMRGNVVGEPSSVLVSRAAIAEAGAFDPGFSMLADWDLWLRLSARSSAAPLDDLATAVLEHGGRMQTTQRGTAEAELARLAAKHEALATANETTFGSPGISRWLAEHRLRQEPSPRHTAELLAAKLRADGLAGTCAATLRRARRRVRPEPAPAWVRALLAD